MSETNYNVENVSKNHGKMNCKYGEKNLEFVHDLKNRKQIFPLKNQIRIYSYF